jgi:Holliday junction DNA helicase RuvB
MNGIFDNDPVQAQRELDKLHTAARSSAVADPMTSQLQPVDQTAAAGNELRPNTWEEIVGQADAKGLLSLMVGSAQRRGRPLDHVLLVGPSGTGKTTFAHVIATSLGARVWQFEAPISADTLYELATVMHDGDILFLDEIHQQAVGDRRGRQSSTQPEILFSVMEDFTLPTGNGVMQFPRITVMGATTDEGALPDAFINRFPIRPVLSRYTEDDMAEIAVRSAQKFELAMTRLASRVFARASRGVPREVNNFIRNAYMLYDRAVVTPSIALSVVRTMCGYTEDGLTRDMQSMLRFLYEKGKRRTGDGEIRYQASVSSIATGIGKSRDVKAIQLRVEPYLIEQGYVQVLHGGRALTDAGVERAQRLIKEELYGR